MTAADIAVKVALRADLIPGFIVPTRPVFAYVSQNNTSDWLFLKKLAADVGYEVVVEGGMLDFRPPAKSSTAPSKGSLSKTDDPLALTMGAHILRLRSVVTSSDQVGQVEVRGWDPAQKQKVTGTASAGTTSASVGTSPSELAEIFGNGHSVRCRCPLFQPDRGGHRSQGSRRPRKQRVRGTRGGGSRQLKAPGRGGHKPEPCR